MNQPDETKMRMLAEKVRDGQATEEEQKEFFTTFNTMLDGLNKELDEAEKASE